MRLAQLLRLTALGIAVLCLLDPPVVVAPVVPVEVDAVIVRSSRDDRPLADDAAETVADAAGQVVERLRDQLGEAGSVRAHEVRAGDSAPCDAQQPCVIVTEGAAAVLAPDRSGPVSIVLLGAPLSPNVELRRATLPGAHLAGQATAAVAIAGTGVEGRVSRVRVDDAGVIVGETEHRWVADGETTLDVPWWPLAAGRRTPTITVDTPGADERTTSDNTLVVATEVTGERWPVVVLERRPSWSGTFIRRSLERDPRFEVVSATDLAPRVSVSSADTGDLAPDRLDAARVIVAGAPDALTEQDVARLERFVVARGGALVLVPDRAMSGAVTRLLSHRWREQLESTPSAAGTLRASEWLIAQDVRPVDDVWAESEAGPAVVATPMGAGVVVTSGALDAWRHRGSDGGFESFWRATAARLASGVGPAVALAAVDDDHAPGSEVVVRLAVRTTRPLDAWRVAAIRSCDNDPPVPVRLWPGDAHGTFHGRVPIGARTGCRVEARVVNAGDAGAHVPDLLRVRETFRWTAAEAEAFAAARGGLLVRGMDVGPLVQSWLAARSSERRPEPRYPMRSWWWLLPLVTTLAAEWWLRRRAGLR